MVLMLPMITEEDAVTAFAYSEPGLPPARVCSSRIRAASAEIWATQASKAEAEGSENVEPTVADADAEGGIDNEEVVVETTGVCVGRVRVMRVLNWGQAPERGRPHRSWNTASASV